MSEMILEIKNLSNFLLRDVSFHLEKGSFTALVGPSGSGKTMTALLIGGLFKGDIRGEIIFRGQKIGWVFQDPFTSWNPVLKIGKQIDEVSLAKDKTIQVLKEVSFKNPERAYKSYPHELSGGMRQRAMIAMALAGSPDLLIADEPTTALDVASQKDILDLLVSLRRTRHLTVLFITHDLSLAREYADGIYAMENGRLVEIPLSFRGRRGDRESPLKKDFSACGLEMTTKVLTEKVTTEKVQDSSSCLVLEAKNLKKTFSKHHVTAIDNVSIVLKKGRTVGLVGESGCGKSTLARVLMGLVPADKGQVFFYGQDIARLKKQDEKSFRRKAQIVFQDPLASLDPRMRVKAILEEPFLIHGAKPGPELRQKIESLLKEVGLGSRFLGRRPHELSGGECQRVAIARAVGLEPEILICDEPVSALDAANQAQILALLRHLREAKGIGILFISHDLKIVRQMSDEILEMKYGKISQ